VHADASPGPGRSADFSRVGERGERDGPTTHRGEPFLSFDAPQEARVALNILTGSKLVVKRIASKETKNPRVPVDGDALVAEVRFQTPRARAEALRGVFFPFRLRLAPRRAARFFSCAPRSPQMTRYCHLKACASF
jgi:hypothetical protein